MNERNDNNKKDLEYLLSEHMDGQLDSHGEAELKRLLAQDAGMRELLRQYTTLDEQLQAWGADELEGIDYDAQRSEIMAAVRRRGQPRVWRRLLLQPTTRLFAAAAVLLITVSLAILIFRRPGLRIGPAEVVVSLLPEVPAGTGRPELAVRLSRMDVGDLALAPPQTTMAGSIPPGTVVVSIGSHRQTPASIFPDEMFGLNQIE